MAMPGINLFMPGFHKNPPGAEKGHPCPHTPKTTVPMSRKKENGIYQVINHFIGAKYINNHAITIHPKNRNKFCPIVACLSMTFPPRKFVVVVCQEN